MNVAARVAARAEPCEILTTHAVKFRIDTSSTPSDLIFKPLGRQQLRNVSGTLDLFAIQAECAELPTDPVCRMRLSTTEGAATIPFGGRVYFFCSLDCTRKFAADPGAYARLLDSEGKEVARLALTYNEADDRQVTAAVPELEEGTYTTAWSSFSTVDGHRLDGSVSFGVGVAPSGGSTTSYSSLAISRR